MKVEIVLNEPEVPGRFLVTNLVYTTTSGETRSVNLNIDFEALDDFSTGTNTLALDFLIISSIVYGIDCLLERYEYSIDGWARDIEVTFPVQNNEIWNHNKNDFQEILTFLTGDYWNISFEESSVKSYFKKRTGRWKSNIPVYRHNEYVFASLFSGGLDSLIGIIDKLESLQQGQLGLLISHFDPTSPGANSDQVRLNQFLSQPANYDSKFDWVQAGVSLSNNDNNGNLVNKEPSLRSRSLLFISIAVYCVEFIPNIDTFLVPENGTISLNFPLTPSRSSSLSTRTTHPYYLRKLQLFITSLGLKSKIVNPYMGMTKGEMVENCQNKGILRGAYSQAVSCGKRGRRMNWDTKTGTNHCGVCMPCIYRRAALHKLGLDNQTYGIDIMTTPKQILAIPDMPALFHFLNRDLTIDKVKRELLVSGSLNEQELSQLSSLVLNVRHEIKRWIHDNENVDLKILAGPL